MTAPIEVLMDHPKGPHVLCRLRPDEGGVDAWDVEDALPKGWTVGEGWCGSPPSALQSDGRWLLAMRELTKEEYEAEYGR